MFRIRKEQMDALARHLEESFALRMVRHLLDDFPVQVAALELQEKDLPPLVRRGMANAERYGVVYEEDVERYIECLVLLGPDFDQDPRYPWAAEILNKKELSGRAKMDQVAD